MLNTTIFINLFAKAESLIKKWTSKHPYITFIALLIGTPVCILSAIFACTALIMLPFSTIMGWI